MTYGEFVYQRRYENPDLLRGEPGEDTALLGRAPKKMAREQALSYYQAKLQGAFADIGLITLKPRARLCQAPLHRASCFE